MFCDNALTPVSTGVINLLNRLLDSSTVHSNQGAYQVVFLFAGVTIG
jgi:hypothetical protein